MAKNGRTLNPFRRNQKPTYTSRKDRRAHLHTVKRDNDKHKFGGCNFWDDSAIYFPQRKKLKGYERDHATGKKRVA